MYALVKIYIRQNMTHRSVMGKLHLFLTYSGPELCGLRVLILKSKEVSKNGY
jgi:hypothetical protein